MYVILDNHECCCPCHYDGIPICDCRQTCTSCDICHLWIAKIFIQNHIDECHNTSNCIKCNYCDINIHPEYIESHLRFCTSRYGTK